MLEFYHPLFTISLKRGNLYKKIVENNGGRKHFPSQFPFFRKSIHNKKIDITQEGLIEQKIAEVTKKE